MDNYNRKIEAFELYKSGKSQKEISEAIGISEKSIGKWKQLYHWEGKVNNLKQSKITEAYLLVSENLRQQTHSKVPVVLGSDQAAKLHQALTTIYKTLSENHLI